MNTFLLRKDLSLLFPLALFSILFALSSCEDGGIVGSSIIEDPPPVKSDTIDIPATEVLSITSFNGNETYFSAGWYDDNVFGEQQVIGMITPSLRTQGIDSIGQNAKGYLKLHVDQVYGDRGATTSFDIVEIGQRWRATSWRPDSIPVLTDNIVASFDITSEDSLMIPLDDEWFGRYSDHWNHDSAAERDSLYRQSMFGLAIVPQNQTKILSFEAEKVELIIDHEVPGNGEDEDNGDEDNGEEEEEDEPGIFRQVMRATAHSVERGQIPVFDGSTAVSNTFDNTFRLRFDITDDFLGSKNISRAELVLYEDTLTMQQDLPSTHRRPAANALWVYLLADDETDHAVLKDANFELVRRESDNSFRVNLTSYVTSNLTGSMDDRDFYIIVRSNNGRIIPTLLHNENSDSRRPKILITSANPEN